MWKGIAYIFGCRRGNMPHTESKTMVWALELNHNKDKRIMGAGYTGSWSLSDDRETDKQVSVHPYTQPLPAAPGTFLHGYDVCALPGFLTGPGT